MPLSNLLFRGWQKHEQTKLHFTRRMRRACLIPAMGGPLRKKIATTMAAVPALLVVLGTGLSPVNAFATDAENVPVPTPRPTLEAEGVKPDTVSNLTTSPENREASQNAVSDEINQAAERADCDQALHAVEVHYDWLGKDVQGSCNIEQSVRLISVETPDGEVAFPGKPVLNCQFAKTFGRWSREIAAPVLAAFAGSRLSAIVTGPGVQCRNRIGGSSTKRSEHASGNAIDISTFKLSNGQTLEVGPTTDIGYSEAFNSLRIAACGYFSTVLGPGANSAHSHHFHFDSGKHGLSGHYRICE